MFPSWKAQGNVGNVAHAGLRDAGEREKCECFEEDDGDMVKGNYTV